MKIYTLDIEFFDKTDKSDQVLFLLYNRDNLFWTNSIDDLLRVLREDLEEILKNELT